MTLKLDILALGAHPDDVELGCGGTILKQIDQGNKIGIIDLTKGELGTRGTPEIRESEANNAAKILGVEFRENLGMADGFFKNDYEHQLKLIKKIREYQPEIILANAPTDRHPDHGRAASLIKEACFLAGLRRIETNHEPWRPKALYNYTQFYRLEPSFLVDVSPYWEKKMEAILAFKSQFHDPNSTEPETLIAAEGFMDFVRSRAIDYGSAANMQYAEGFIANRTIGVSDLSSLH